MPKGHKKGVPAWNKGLKGFLAGDKHPMYGKHHSPEAKMKMSLAFRFRKPLKHNAQFKKGHKHSEDIKRKISQWRKNHILPIKDTKPERMMQLALNLNNIEFEKHKPFVLEDKSCHQVDIFVKPNICIEVDGNYWHSLPHVIKRDMKIDHDLSARGYNVIRIWEKDIYLSSSKCALNILNLINQFGRICDDG